MQFIVFRFIFDLDETHELWIMKGHGSHVSGVELSCGRQRVEDEKDLAPGAAQSDHWITNNVWSDYVRICQN